MSDYFKGKNACRGWHQRHGSGNGAYGAESRWQRGTDGQQKDKAEAVQKELSPLGSVSVIAANLMTEEGMNAIRQEINANHRDISLMVNAAGIFMPKGFTEHLEADYDMYLMLNWQPSSSRRTW